MQIGGMALRDGVMLQSERHWAAAIRTAEGEIEIHSGAKMLLPGREVVHGIPVLRGLARMIESMTALPALRMAAGRGVLPQEDPKLLAATVGSAVAASAVRRRRTGSALLRETTVAALMLAPAMLAVRSSELSRFHGAEHKSVAAYETGDPASTSAREHDRCGTNLVVPLALTSVLGGLVLRGLGKERQPLAVLSVGLLSIGSAVEIFNWMTRHKGEPLADMLRLPGVEMQHLFTTREPTEDQLEVAEAAMAELLRIEGEEPETA